MGFHTLQDLPALLLTLPRPHQPGCLRNMSRQRRQFTHGTSRKVIIGRFGTESLAFDLTTIRKLNLIHPFHIASMCNPPFYDRLFHVKRGGRALQSSAPDGWGTSAIRCDKKQHAAVKSFLAKTASCPLCGSTILFTRPGAGVRLCSVPRGTRK